MRAQLTYPTKASFHLEEHWSLPVGDIEVSFDVTEGQISAIICTWPLGRDDKAPTIRPLQEGQRGFGGVDFHLARREEVEHLVRTVQGLLALHGTIDVDFERPTLEWLADTPEEEMGIKLTLSAKPADVDVYKPEKLDFGLVGRAVLAAPNASKLEVALSFLRRGRRDLKEHRYIEAIYNCFFFLETQFAPGYSNPREVGKRLKENAIVLEALAAIRHDPIDPPLGFTTPEVVALWEERMSDLARSDDEIISDLVSLRGKLHHHAMRRPETWHPDKGIDYRIPAYTLHDIAVACAKQLVSPVVDDVSLGPIYMQSAERANAVTSLRFEARGLFPSRNSTRLSVNIRTAGTVIDRGMIASADREFRRILDEQVPDAQLHEYTITHMETDRVYGRYERNLLTQMRKSRTRNGLTAAPPENQAERPNSPDHAWDIDAEPSP